MPYYRLYFVDRRGHFGRVEGFAAKDDAAATAFADSRADEVKELWCGGRRLKQWRGDRAA